LPHLQLNQNSFTTHVLPIKVQSLRGLGGVVHPLDFDWQPIISSNSAISTGNAQCSTRQVPTRPRSTSCCETPSNQSRRLSSPLHGHRRGSREAFARSFRHNSKWVGGHRTHPTRPFRAPPPERTEFGFPGPLEAVVIRSTVSGTKERP
jgi:hypothetical protein